MNSKCNDVLTNNNNNNNNEDVSENKSKNWSTSFIFGVIILALVAVVIVVVVLVVIFIIHRKNASFNITPNIYQKEIDEVFSNTDQLAYTNKIINIKKQLEQIYNNKTIHHNRDIIYYITHGDTNNQFVNQMSNKEEEQLKLFLFMLAEESNKPSNDLKILIIMKKIQEAFEEINSQYQQMNKFKQRRDQLTNGVQTPAFHPEHYEKFIENIEKKRQEIDSLMKELNLIK